MAVAIQMDFKGATLEQYDEVIGKMGFTPGGKGDPGALFHWAAQTDDGIRVTDVWKSKEEFEEFSQNKIGPLSQEAGFPGPPSVQFFELHNHLVAG